MAGQLDSDGDDLLTHDGRRLCALVPGDGAVVGFSRGQLLYAWTRDDGNVTLSVIQPDYQGGRPLGWMSVRNSNPGEVVMATAGFGDN